MDESIEEIKRIEDLFKAWQPALCNLAYNIVLDAAAAKDIVQEVFMQLWRNRHEVEFGPSIKGYLFKATTHFSLNYIEKEKRINLFRDKVKQELTAQTDHGNRSMEVQELELKVRESIEKLPPKCKAIYLLSRQEGLSYRQIAEHLDLSPKTVENQMGIALEKLRNSLKPFLTREFLEIAILAVISHLLFQLFFT